MERHSRQSGSLLNELEGRIEHRGRPRHDRPQPSNRIVFAPTVIRVEDPRVDLEELLKRHDDGIVPEARPSRLMQRLRNKERVNVTESGVVEFESRRCCLETIAGVQQRLHALKLPFEFVCENCSTRYAVVQMIR